MSSAATVVSEKSCDVQCENLGQNPPPEATESENFKYTSADVIFKSCDNVLFRIHRKNLETNTGAFPPAEFDTKGEFVPLTEDSLTLDRLFHYVYPQRHPGIDSLPTEDFFKLAEAAEKYEVFALMNICTMRMKHIVPEHPREAFEYASKHDYPDIMNIAAPLLLDCPLDEFVTNVSPHLAIPWIRYVKSWSRTVESAILTTSGTWKTSCSDCHRDVPLAGAEIKFSLNPKLRRDSLLVFLKSSLPELHGTCTGCGKRFVLPSDYGLIATKLENALDAVPKFSTFLRPGQV